MDKGILRNFAINARNDLEERIENKINSYFIDEKFTIEQRGDLYYLKNNNHSLTLSSSEFEKRELLIKRIDALTLERVIEEAAYTWFNRLIAIRYMEIHDYLPLTKDNLGLGIRVLSSSDNQFEPEILKYQNLINTKLDIKFNKKYYEKINHDNDKFKYVLNLIINKMKLVIPQVFGGVTDYVDVLLPDNLLNEDSFIYNLIQDIPETYFNNVEIIGWLYQYYNQTKKDEVISAKKVYKKHEIAYATQLFTPDWIVKYMVQNSLGKYWLEHSSTNNDHLIESWKYLVKDNIKKTGVTKSPEDITFIDPCSGSGHILVYAFDLFYQIYLSAGYSSQIIPSLIISNNLYGLDIDDRAGQLSVLSILLKSRELDKNIFNKKESKFLNILSIQELKSLDEFSVQSLPEESQLEIEELVKEYSNSKEIGSLLFGKKKDYTSLLNSINNSDFIVKSNLQEKIIHILKQNDLLINKYDVVVTNPPYLNNRFMSSEMKNYINLQFSKGKQDLFSAFILRNSIMGKKDSYLAFMTPYVWMFILTYLPLREKILNELSISTLIQLEYSALEEAIVPLCSFVLKNSKSENIGSYFRLVDFTGGMEKQEKHFLEILNAQDKRNYFQKKSEDFLSIDGCPISYWASPSVLKNFKENIQFGEIAELKQGIITGNNNLFLKYWFEISNEKINKKWFYHNKGGNFKKWYGNHEYVLNWENNGFELKNYKNSLGKLMSRPQNLTYLFKEHISWSLITSGDFSARLYDDSFTFNVAGLGCFVSKKDLYYILALLNTKVILNITKMLNPTINMNVGDISRIPIVSNTDYHAIVSNLSKTNVILSKEDWDLDELSWNFTTHPFVIESRISHFGNVDGIDHSLGYLYDHLKTTIQMRFDKIKENEEKINKIFIEVYDLEDELKETVLEKDITVTKLFDSSKEIYPEIKGNKYIKTKEDIVKSFISYFVGCLFGRYSLDQDGIVFAGGNFNYNNYKKFKPLKDNIIPITDNKYFSEDIVYKFLEFIEILFSKDTLNENVEFIANTLGKKDLETDVETIRRYFINDFYRDHVQTYKKKPIYWLFNSGKDDGFKGLMYIHRYDENLIPKIRLDYVHAMQNIYQRELEEVKYKLSTDLVLTEKKNLQDREVDLNKKIVELNNYDELIAHAANQRITLDLDDGIDVNYDKLKELLAKK